MSTKTLRKRIALVAVSALGFGLMSAVPSSAATNFRASFTAPSTLDVTAAAVAAGTTSVSVGTLQIDLSTLDSSLDSGDTATVTMSSSAAGSDNFRDALSFSKTVVGASSAASLNLDAATGYNTLNNGTVTVANSANASETVILAPTANDFANASGRAYLNVNFAGLTAADTGDIVNFDITVASGGVISTFRQTLTLTVGPKTGTNTITPTTGLQTVNLGGSATVTRVVPISNVPANTATTARVFTLADSTGTPVSGGHTTFSVAATAVGGTVNCVRDSATQITCTPLKNALEGLLTITYTTTVNVASTATAGHAISVDASFTITIQPYTPTYSYSTATLVAGTGSYHVPASQGGDGIIWVPATAVGAYVARVDVDQFDQNNNAISNALFAKSVSATITGKGSFTEVTSASGNASVKTRSETAANNLLSGTSDLFDIWSDGTTGEGKVEISVDGVVLKTYTVRFFGDVAKVEATALRPVGTTAGGANGQVVGSALSGTNAVSTSGERFNGLAQSSVIGTVSALEVLSGAAATPSVTGIAVKVTDANGWVIPTAAPVVTSSNLTVVSSASRLFIDGGVTNMATAQISAGTFVQHFSYTTVAGSTSGATSNLTFTVVNSAGTAISSTAVAITVGGSLASGKLAFDKAAYMPGEVAVITATGLDAAGNKAADGQNLMGADFESSLNFTAPASFALVNGTRARTVYAPASAGTWTITATDAAGKTYTATAEVTNVAAAAKAAGDAAEAAAKAATEAATAAGDAVAEATDAANAATDAANAAAEAADAATAAAQDAADAVAALSTQVTELVSALRKQITSLTNLVIKIQRKVRA
jgi:trimeric autotransporter adhesin